MTNKQIDALADRLAASVIQGLEQQRARKRAAARRNKRSQLRRRLETLGTPKFKPPLGLYPAVAETLGLNRTHVYQVAKGMRTSPRVLKALREEIGLRALAESGAPRKKQLATSSEQLAADPKGCAA